MTPPAQPSSILVVDDTLEVRAFLSRILIQAGNAIRSFSRGAPALEAAAESPPDLILLDVSMPEMDGYEVCTRLKADSRLAAIPVIFISALDETLDKLKAFQRGAVDYVTKPPQAEEVLARVRTHLQLQALQQELKFRNERLEEMVQERTRQLSEAHAQLSILDQTKSDFLDLISHELRTPLTGLLGIGDILLGQCPATMECNRLKELYRESRRRLLTIMEDALLLARIDLQGGASSSKPISLQNILKPAIEKAEVFAKFRKVTVDTAPAPSGTVLGDTALLIKAFQALLETAVKLSVTGQRVRIACEPGPSQTRCVVVTRGWSIRPELLPRFFGVFTISETIVPGGDLGLGPPVAERIIRLFGGTVTVENREPSGVRLIITLKSAPPEAAMGGSAPGTERNAD